MPVISVIIPCFNAELWVREAIDSVQNQDVRGVEIIVIDDGSTDNSAKLIAENYPTVNLIRTENQGPSKARNLGIKLARGEFIQFLDADDLLAPHKFACQLEVLNKSGADIAYGDWQRLAKNPEGNFVKGEVIHKEIRNPEIDLFTGDGWQPIHSYLYQRSIVEKVGKFNENLPIIQDARFTLDCALYGGRFIYCEGVMAYYRMHSYATVSHKDPVLFIRDCLQIAFDVDTLWRSCDVIDEDRKKALLKVYGYIARSSFDNDRPTFESAYNALTLHAPHYLPDKPRMLRFLSKLTGYRNAENIASWYRKAKKIIGLDCAKNGR